MTQAGGCADNACRRRPPNQFGSGVAALTVRSARVKTCDQDCLAMALLVRQPQRFVFAQMRSSADVIE